MSAVHSQSPSVVMTVIARPRIPGMPLVAERPHNKHGSSVFISLKVNNVSVCEVDNVELIAVELPGVVYVQTTT